MDQRMWGADADALEALGRDMQAAASRLDTLSRQISAQLMGSPWDGVDADRFRADWNRRYRGQLRSSSEFLRHAHGTLVASGNAQRQASADGGGVGHPLVSNLGAPMGNLVSGWQSGRTPDWQLRAQAFGAALWGTARETAKGWGEWTAPLSAIGTLAGAATVGAYTKAYGPMLRLGDVMRFKQSPILQALDRIEGPVSRIVDNPAFKGVGKVAGLVSTAADVVDGVHVLADYRAGEADRGDLARAGADTAASALKSSKNPVSYLAGLNVSIWSDVVEEGVKAFQSGDFTLKGLPSPFSGDAFRDVYVQSAKDVGSQLFSKMKGWF